MLRLLINNKGETLIETVISIMLFAILFVAIAGMLTQAENILRNTRQKNDIAQDTVNAILSQDYAYDSDVVIEVQPAQAKLTLNAYPKRETTVIDTVTLKRTDSLVYFYGE